MDDTVKAGRVLTLLIELRSILEREKEDNWIRGIQAAINMLTAALHRSENVKNALEDVQSIYKTMYSGSNTFSDFYIWRDNFDERVKVNRELEHVTSELWDLLQ